MKEIFEKIIMESLNTVKDEIADRIIESRRDRRNHAQKDASFEGYPVDEHVQRVEFSPGKKSHEDMEFDDFIQSFDKQRKNTYKTVEDPVLLPEASQNTPSSAKDNLLCGSNSIGMINAYNKNKRLNIMVVWAACGLIFCLLMLTFYNGDLPGEVVGIVSTISGIFGACLKDAYSFEFGSSRGSKDKDDKISSTILERLRCK